MNDSAALSANPTGASRVVALATLYTLTLRQHLHGRRWLLLGLLFLLPAALAIVIRLTARWSPSIQIEFRLPFMFMPQAILPLVALIYSSGIIGDEVEDQTITYLLVRPIPKWALYVVKLAATITTTVLLTIIFTAITYAAIYAGSGVPAADVLSRCAKAAAVHSLAMLAYCCLFGLMALALKRILIAGVIYIATIEGLFANIPFGIRWITVIYYTRLLAHRWMGFTVPLPDGRIDDLSAETWQLYESADPFVLPHPNNATAVAILAIASLVCVLAGAWICARREFRVKTPEGA
jgi:ABC-2 type transport system permease protein